MKKKKVVKKKVAKFTGIVLEVQVTAGEEKAFGYRTFHLVHPTAGRGYFDNASTGYLCEEGLTRAGLHVGRRFRLVPLRAKK